MDVEDQNKQTREFLENQDFKDALDQAPIPIQNKLEEAESIKKWLKELVHKSIQTGIKIRELQR